MHSAQGADSSDGCAGDMPGFHGSIQKVRLKPDTTYCKSELIFGSIRLPGALTGPHQQFDFAPFHLFLEQAESSLLPQVEHLIDALECLADLGPDAGVEVAQDFELGSERLVLTGGLRQPAKFLQHSAALHLTSTTNVLQRLHAREESWKLIVTQLQLLLRLHHHVGVEEPLNFGGRHTLFGEWARRRRDTRASLSGPGRQRHHRQCAGGHHDRQKKLPGCHLVHN